MEMKQDKDRPATHHLSRSTKARSYTYNEYFIVTLHVLVFIFLLSSHRHHSTSLVSPLTSKLIHSKKHSSSSLSTNLAATKIVWFREHAIRINNNEAISTAVNDCISESGANINSNNVQNNSILPLYLWSTVEDTDIGTGKGTGQGTTEIGTPISKETGGTAKDVFVANALQSLNNVLDNRLLIGGVKINKQDDTEINIKMIQELIRVCHKSNADSVYYLKSYHENKHDTIAKQLIQNGIKPRPFAGSFSLINYDEHNVPWEDIVLEHPWRSPLIPFVEYVKEQMKGEKNDETFSNHNDILSSELLRQFMKFRSKSYVSNPIDLNELVQSVGKTNGGTDWGTNICKSWPASESHAKQALSEFLNSLEAKNDGGSINMKRTHLASKLSPYLARGMISPRQVYNGIIAIGDDADTDSFVRRICWRDYTYAVIDLYPDVTKGKSIRDGYDSFDYRINHEEKVFRLDRWKNGQCGFPLIDAGMRQLKVEGWMPQKVRLACSTFLVEGLGISWREGMDHFAEFLVDFDNAINSNMWMNAGCVGLDPYYVGMNYKRRMYWDKDGSYIRKWCPELANLPDTVEVHLGKTTKVVDCLYEPWATPSKILEEANVYLGSTYPTKVCDDRKTRSQFFRDMRNLRSTWPASRIDDKKRDMVYMGMSEIGLFTPRALQERRMMTEH
jgi:deoxyribodipyrimidine photolyase